MGVQLFGTGESEAALFRAVKGSWVLLPSAMTGEGRHASPSSPWVCHAQRSRLRDKDLRLGLRTRCSHASSNPMRNGQWLTGTKAAVWRCPTTHTVLASLLAAQFFWLVWAVGPLMSKVDLFEALWRSHDHLDCANI